jgi:uncharacterized membrane protein
MEKQTHLTPKFFFVSLGVLVALITSIASFLVLLFEVLNKKFPDVLNASYTYGYNSYNFETIRASLATLIIFFPIFIFLSYLWNKESRNNLGSVNTIIRKWMIYLILFLASLVILIDLVTLVRYFVSGEISIRFVYKVIGALIVAGIVDFYYSIKMNDVNKITEIFKIFFGRQPCPFSNHRFTIFQIFQEKIKQLNHVTKGLKVTSPSQKKKNTFGFIKRLYTFK